MQYLGIIRLSQKKLNISLVSMIFFVNCEKIRNFAANWWNVQLIFYGKET